MRQDVKTVESLLTSLTAAVVAAEVRMATETDTARAMSAWCDYEHARGHLDAVTAIVGAQDGYLHTRAEVVARIEVEIARCRPSSPELSALAWCRDLLATCGPDKKARATGEVATTPQRMERENVGGR